MGVTSIALAQFQVGTNGQARDANNRIGANGLNEPTSTGVRVNGNQIVTGNVTGGQQFRGFVPYTDPGAFRGVTAGQNVDNFVRQSAGVPIGVYNNNNAQNVVPFYGDARAVAPPAGTVPIAQGVPGSVGVAEPLFAQPLSNDLRLTNPYDALLSQQTRPGELMLPGPVDPKTQDLTVITATPLYGIRQWRMGDQNDQQFLSNFTDLYANRRAQTQLDANTINRMRSELQQEPNDTNTGNAADANANGNANGNNAQLNNNALDNRLPGEQGNRLNDINSNQNRLDRPFDAANPNVENRPLDSNVGGNNALSSAGTNTGQSVRNRLLTSRRPGLTLATNSPQYREMQQRLARYRQNEGAVADVQANAKFQQDKRLDELAQQQQGNQPGQPGVGPMANNPAAPGGNLPGPAQPGVAPNVPGGAANVPGGGVPGGGVPGMQGNAPGGSGPGTGTGANAQPQQPTEPLPGVTSATPRTGAQANADANKPKPLVVKSLSAGMPQSAATNVMKEAEDLMKAGRYTSALDKFDQVDQVTPNDPLVSLGRATAELGASYYQRADAHLREAFTRNPALLLGQYDLREMLGNDRLDYLVRDLKDIAKNDPKQARPVFLLSYIYYNTGDERRASGYLDLAEKRAGGNDPFFKLLRQHWSLPSDVGAGEELNK